MNARFLYHRESREGDVASVSYPLWSRPLAADRGRRCAPQIGRGEDRFRGEAVVQLIEWRN